MLEVKAVHDKVRNGHNIQLPNKLAGSDNTGPKVKYIKSRLLYCGTVTAQRVRHETVEKCRSLLLISKHLARFA